MTYQNIHGQPISETDAHAEQWAGRPVMDENGNPILLDESAYLPLSPEQIVVRDQGLWPGPSVVTTPRLLTARGSS